ncbi:hypothetical protein D3C83_282280 [compost metagenome]
MVTRLLSRERLEVAVVGTGPATLGVLLWPVSVTAPEVTRTSEVPRRCPGR